jgi:glycosyltransferase involved in cell wall biosynthesis
MNSTKTPVSVLIPTKDEERNIETCIRAVAWADEIVVFDSFSTDKTVDLAKTLGAMIVQRKFDNFSDHKNWAFDHIDFSHPWILMVDADERITEPLAKEITDLLASTPTLNGYYVARKNNMAGQWVVHGGYYPNWSLRLLKRGFGRYESRIVHEHILLDGPAGFLKNPLLHKDDKGMERYFDRHNTYSSMEAVEVHRNLLSGRRERLLPSALFSKGPERRRFLKNLSYRYLPMRSLFKFLWMYVIRLGFLDGRGGFRFCLLHTFYEYQVSLKLEELRDKNSPIYRKYATYLESGADF